MLRRCLGVVALGVGIWISLVVCVAEAGSPPREEGQAEPAIAAGDAHSPSIVGTEAFPRIAMLWSPAQDLVGTRPQRMAKYGVSVVGVEALGLRWERAEHPDLAETFEPATIDTARTTLAEVLAANPRAVVCCELYFFEARRTGLSRGPPLVVPRPGGPEGLLLAGLLQHGPEQRGVHRTHRQADPRGARRGRGESRHLPRQPAVRPDGQARLDEPAPEAPGLTSGDRRAGQLGLVEHRAGVDRAPRSTGSCTRTRSPTPATTTPRRSTGGRASTGDLLRAPRISVNEKFGARGDTASMLRELSRTLVYTDAYFSYTDSTNGHRHSWRPEWDAPLGKAIDPVRTPMAGQLARRALRGRDRRLAPGDRPGPRHDRARHAPCVGLRRRPAPLIHPRSRNGARPRADALTRRTVAGDRDRSPETSTDF